MTFGPFTSGRQRLAHGVAHLGDVIGAGDVPDPFHTDAAHGLLDRMLGRPRLDRSGR